jgi:hypothetical protein
VDLILNPLLTAVILVVVHFLKKLMVLFGTLEQNLMDTQLLIVHMNTARMATFTLVVGKNSGYKLTWPIWMKEFLLLKGAALAISAMMIGSIQTIQTMAMTVTMVTMAVMTATIVGMMATMATMAVMMVMMATMAVTMEIATKLSKLLSKMLNKLLLMLKIFLKVLKVLLPAFAPSRLTST